MTEDAEIPYKISADMQSVFMAMQIQSDEILSQQHEIETLKKQNEWLRQQFNLNRQREFGRSTEKSAASQDEKMDGSGEEAKVPGEQETFI